jgi:hypothetical protein
MKNHYLEQNETSYHDTHEIKEVLEKVRKKNMALLQCRIDFCQSKKDAMGVLDEKIRRALVESIFAELRMAFGIKD